MLPHHLRQLLVTQPAQPPKICLLLPFGPADAAVQQKEEYQQDAGGGLQYRQRLQQPLVRRSYRCFGRALGYLGVACEGLLECLQLSSHLIHHEPLSPKLHLLHLRQYIQILVYFLFKIFLD